MTLALIISSLTAFGVSSEPNIINFFLGSGLKLLAMFAVQIGLVFLISWKADELPLPVMIGAFLLYSATVGITMSVVLLVYTKASIVATLGVTAGTFAGCSLYGLVTKRDLSSIGSFLFMALLGLILATVVNIFLQSSMFNLLISAAGVLIFVALTAYDSQKIKNLSNSDENGAILAALSLYLDFMNLFIYLLQFMGKKK
jgi:FtsH-binding integral membrane protein